MTKPPSTTPPLSSADLTKAEPVPMAWALPEPHNPVMRSHVQNWLAHLEAGRIGAHLCSNASLLENGTPEPPPHVVATREANERLFARLAGRV